MRLIDAIEEAAFGDGKIVEVFTIYKSDFVDIVYDNMKTAKVVRV